jgi:hypothetical protein
MKKLIGSAALVVCGIAFAILAFEVVLRVIGFSAPIWHQPDARLGWALRPGTAAQYTAEGNAFVRINAAGQRDVEHALDKPDGVYRIAVIGDSYSEAMQVERDKAFWSLLPARLAACGFAKGRSIEALNFGVAGYGTAQEYIVLQTDAIRYRPDLVLLQFTTGNDVRNNSFALEPEKDQPFYHLAADGRLHIDTSFAAEPKFRGRMSFLSEAVRKLTDKSRVFQLIRLVRESSFIRPAQAGGVEQGLEASVLAPPRERLWDEAWRVTEGLISMSADFATRNGAKFALVSVPYAIQALPDQKQREQLQAKLGVPDLLYPDRRLAALADKDGFEAVTLAEPMLRSAQEKDAPLYGFANTQLGFGHWNETGHRVAAELIAQRLCSSRRLSE